MCHTSFVKLGEKLRIVEATEKLVAFSSDHTIVEAIREVIWDIVQSLFCLQDKSEWMNWSTHGDSSGALTFRRFRVCKCLFVFFFNFMLFKVTDLLRKVYSFKYTQMVVMTRGGTDHWWLDVWGQAELSGGSQLAVSWKLLCVFFPFQASREESVSRSRYALNLSSFYLTHQR